MSIIQGDSMLSSISNISVMIQPDGSSMFNFQMYPNNNDHEQSNRLCEVKINDIFPFDQQFQENNSILDKINKKQEREGSIIQIYHTPILPQVSYSNNFNEKSWVITQLKGVSEDENSREEEQEKEQINQKKLKNQTKNIPKNYGKAIISFIQKYKNVIAQICELTNVPFEDFYIEMAQIKKTINTIADLRRLWIEYKYAKCMRIISNLFFRKYSLNYIFNSRICNFSSHIKYRHRLCEAIRSPHSFKHIKDY